VVGTLTITLLRIYLESNNEKNVENRLRFDKVIDISLLPRFYGPWCREKIL